MPGRVHKILIVDDEQVNRRLMTGLIGLLGHDTVTAADGLEGLEAVRRERPDLVFLDVMMPRMNGFEACRRLKTDPQTAFIPVVIVTALSDREHRIQGIEAGADDFLTRPVDQEELSARVSTLLHTKELHDELETAHRAVGRLAEVTEAILRDFQPSRFERESSEISLVAQLFKGSGPRGEAPQHIAICIPCSRDALGCHIYGCDGRDVTSVASVTCTDYPRWHAGREGQDAAFSNREEEGVTREAYQERFCPPLRGAVGPVENYAEVVMGRRYFLALNYPAGGTRFDADVLRAFAVHASFLETIAAQIGATEDAFLYTIGALARAAEANDEDTGDHIIRVNTYSRILAEEIGLPPREVEVLSYSAQMHDVGKIHVHPDILRKAGKLTPAEFEHIKTHTRVGVKILGSEPRLRVASEIALRHHERWDGTGYPGGLAGEEIPISARIVAAADVYDALRMPRSYKPALTHQEALAIMTRGDGRTSPRQFDPRVLAALVRRADDFAEVFDHYAPPKDAPE